MSYLLEACVATKAQAIIAVQGGADQLELCADLALGGLTPDLQLTLEVIAAVAIPVKVMIRPRAGDFVFTDDEVNAMNVAIGTFGSYGLQHFVIGMARPDNVLAVDQIRDLCGAFPEYQFTLHKVIDQVRDPLAAIRSINTIPNLTSILTSGGAATALAGAAQIERMQRVLHPEKQIIAAGRITAANLAEVRTRINAPIYHGRRIVEGM
jgi:copper homeostasis protein